MDVNIFVVVGFVLTLIWLVVLIKFKLKPEDFEHLSQSWPFYIDTWI